MCKIPLKALILMTLVGSVATTDADTLGLEVGSYQWTADYSGIFSVDNSNSAGTNLDIKDDLGFTDESHNILWAKLEHPIPVLPNIKIVSSDLSVAANSILQRDIVFGGDTYATNEDVSTQVDFSNTEYTLYYELLDNWLNLDAGITFRQYDGLVSVTTAPTGSNINNSELLDFTIPLIYVNGRFDLPLTGFFAEAQINIISYDNDSLSDTELAVGYESDIGLGAKLGHRSFNMEVDESDFKSNLDFSGSYFSVFYHF